MKAKFTNFCESHFNGVTNFVNRVLFSIAAIVAIVTIGNIVCPVF